MEIRVWLVPTVPVAHSSSDMLYIPMRVELLCVFLLETKQDLNRYIAFLMSRTTHLGIHSDLSRIL